jgi:hypothetical protein
MMDDDSPFWATPPYILLTDVLQLDKVEPWNVDVGKLVVGFLDEMKRLGDIDFRSISHFHEKDQRTRRTRPPTS